MCGLTGLVVRSSSLLVDISQIPRSGKQIIRRRLRRVGRPEYVKWNDTYQYISGCLHFVTEPCHQSSYQSYLLLNELTYCGRTLVVSWPLRNQTDALSFWHQDDSERPLCSSWEKPMESLGRNHMILRWSRMMPLSPIHTKKVPIFAPEDFRETLQEILRDQNISNEHKWRMSDPLLPWAKVRY